MCREPDYSVQQNSGSLDEVVDEHDKLIWNGETECLCGFEIDNELELRRLLNRQVARSRTFENPVDVGGGAAEQVIDVCTVRHESACLGKSSEVVHGR